VHEIVINLHVHTRYSDGSGSHGEVARAALRAGLDAVIVTDHNVLVRGAERYVRDGPRKVLVLVGEEVHDRNRVPQKDHLLVLGANQELSAFAHDVRLLLKRIREAGGLSFIAHPYDPAARAFDQPDLSWESWSMDGFAGLELWNGASELKTLVPTRLHGVFYAFLPTLVAHGPLASTLKKWDELLSERPVVAIGSSDAHATRMQLGPLRRLVFPYEYHFGAINTHVMLSDPLTGDASRDASAVYAAIAAGHCFLGYDRPHPTNGSRFLAHGPESRAIMGDQIPGQGGVTLQVHLPAFAEIRLLRDGDVIQVANRAQALTHLAREPGVYRIEAYRRHLGRRRGWIFSNPVCVL
jgi:hypothetical protein